MQFLPYTNNMFFTKIATTKAEKRLSIKNGQWNQFFYLYLYFSCNINHTLLQVSFDVLSNDM
jgi:hypothetical protein